MILGDRALRDPAQWLVFILPLLCYLVAMPKTVALEDDSLFILSAYFNGVSHPPGYPLYTLLLKVFVSIPFAEIAARAHASSAFFAALSCVLLYRVFILVGCNRVVASIAALSFAVTGTFWSQAIITEVYSLNCALNVALLYCCLKIHFDFNRNRGANLQPREFILFSVFFGLALANHWPLTVLALPAYLLLIARPYYYLQHKLIVMLPAAVVAFAAYLYLYLNNQSSPWINFNGEFAGFGEFVDFILRRHYANVDQNLTAGWADKLRFWQDLVWQFIRELNVLLVFALLGFYRALRSAQLRLPGLALGWLWLANSFILALLANFDYSQLYTAVFEVFTLVSVAALYVIAGYEIAALSQRKILRDGYAVFILALSLGVNLYLSLPQNYRHDYRWGEAYAQAILAEIPADAIVFSDGEIELGLLSYYRYIKKQRPDITLYSSSGLLLNNRLFDYRLADKKQFIEAYIAQNPTRKFYAANNYYQVDVITRTLFTDKLGHPAGETKSTITSTDIDLVLQWTADPSNRDPWTRLALENLRQKAIAILAPQLNLPIDEGLRGYIIAALDKLVQSDADSLHFLKSLIKDQPDIVPANYLQTLSSIKRDDLPSKQDDSHFVYLLARAGQVRQSDEHLQQARLKACRNWPSPKNMYCTEPPD